MTERLTDESEALLAKVSSEWDMDPWGEYESARRRMETDLAAIEAAAVRRAVRRAAQPDRSASDGVGVEVLAEAIVKAGLHYRLAEARPSARAILAALATPPPAPDGSGEGGWTESAWTTERALEQLCARAEWVRRDFNEMLAGGVEQTQALRRLRGDVDSLAVIAAEGRRTLAANPPAPAAAVSGEARLVALEDVAAAAKALVAKQGAVSYGGTLVEYRALRATLDILALAAARDTGARGEGREDGMPYPVKGWPSTVIVEHPVEASGRPCSCGSCGWPCHGEDAVGMLHVDASCTHRPTPPTTGAPAEPGS